MSSNEPSHSPTSLPSNVPSMKLSSTPSDIPTILPTDLLSIQPLDMPLDAPSHTPTSLPSNIPIFCFAQLHRSLVHRLLSLRCLLLLHRFLPRAAHKKTQTDSPFCIIHYPDSLRSSRLIGLAPLVYATLTRSARLSFSSASRSARLY